MYPHKTFTCLVMVLTLVLTLAGCYQAESTIEINPSIYGAIPFRGPFISYLFESG